MKAIGLTGLAGSGKNTVAGIMAGRLVELGFTVQMDAFTTGIKRELHERMGWDGTKSPFWREAMQRLGVHMRHAKGRCYWISDLIRRIQEPEPDFVIVTDVRFANEMSWTPMQSSLFLVTGRGGLTDERLAQHETERDVAKLIERGHPIERTIENSGTLEETTAQVREKLDKWLMAINMLPPAAVAVGDNLSPTEGADE